MGFALLDYFSIMGIIVNDELKPIAQVGHLTFNNLTSLLPKKPDFEFLGR